MEDIEVLDYEESLPPSPRPPSPPQPAPPQPSKKAQPKSKMEKKPAKKPKAVVPKTTGVPVSKNLPVPPQKALPVFLPKGTGEQEKRLSLPNSKRAGTDKHLPPISELPKIPKKSIEKMLDEAANSLAQKDREAEEKKKKELESRKRDIQGNQTPASRGVRKETSNHRKPPSKSQRDWKRQQEFFSQPGQFQHWNNHQQFPPNQFQAMAPFMTTMMQPSVEIVRLFPNSAPGRSWSRGGGCYGPRPNKAPRNEPHFTGRGFGPNGDKNRLPSTSSAYKRQGGGGQRG